MQFMPATWALYGVDGDGDGRADITNDADSAMSAANYLTASGVSAGEDGVRRAIFAYNHADWYVNDVLYYAVDHSPSYLWNAATWENSEALLPFLPTVLGGPDAWDSVPTVRRAIEIRDGVIQNPAILTFQARDPRSPHRPLAS